MTSNGAAVTAGVAVGIAICILLFLIVLALVAYNVYLWQRRRANERRFRDRAVKRPPAGAGWRERPLLYGSQEGFKGSGTINKGYAPSMASVNTTSTGRGVGPAPKADVDDMDDLDPDDVSVGIGEGPGGKPGRPALPGKQSMRNGVSVYPSAQTECFPTAQARQEITLKPGQLEAQWQQGKPLGRTQNYRASPASANPAPSRPLRQTAPHRNSYLAVLEADTGRLSGSDTSLTGCGAQYVPSISMSPGGNIHNGGLSYNHY